MAIRNRDVDRQEQYRVWWSTRRDALHRSKAEDWSSQNAYEMICLFGKGGVLLDVGCGNAQLLTHLAPHFDEVVGIDFSPTMLEAAAHRLKEFRIANARLEVGDACSFPASIARADVILSNGVAQNLSPAQLRQHLQECRRVLRRGGCVGICGIPWANLKTQYAIGALRDPAPKASVRRVLWSSLKRLQLRLADLRGDFMADGIGQWYGREELRSIAASEGFDCEIIGSWYYEYRFHARLRLRDDS